MRKIFLLALLMCMFLLAAVAEAAQITDVKWGVDKSNVLRLVVDITDSAGYDVKLEELTGSYPGVDKAYAIQAGREVRIMVKPEVVSEDNMILLARDVAKKIEAELEYPGQIKVNVIRETKAVEYAK